MSSVNVVYTEPKFICRDMDMVFPPLARAIEEAIPVAHANGLMVYPFETWRSPQRQEFLYKQKNPVTKGGPWKSWHQYGLAVDVVFKPDGKTWTWDGMPFAKVAQIFKDFGLAWGGPSDGAHFQMTGGIHIEMAQAMARTYGIQRLWLEVKQLMRQG